MMKKIYGFLVLATLLFAVGCKQDPPILPASLQNSQLLGKWFLKELVIRTQVGNQPSTDSDPITGFTTTTDFFQFDAGNQSILSSTIYGKAFQGYYSANAAASTLAFKSGEFLVRYKVESLTLLQLEISEVFTNADDTGTITTTTNFYTYSRLP